MFTLVKGGEVYSPMPLGKRDVLLLNGKIIKIAPEIQVPTGFIDHEVIDATDQFVVPGFIDYHNHFLGGGGNSGYASRAPETPFRHFVQAGITTVVGCLGADTATRTMGALYGKACTLDDEGITAYIYSGGTYPHPTPTLTGSIQSDMYFVDKVLGAGEVSLSDLGAGYDSLGPGTEYLANLAAKVICASKISGKPGIIILQVAGHGVMLEPLFEILRVSNMPIRSFVPAHANMHKKYLECDIRFAKMGGTLDITSSYNEEVRKVSPAIKASKTLKIALEEGVSYDNITMSSDGGGARPYTNEAGEHVGSTYLSVTTMFDEFQDMIRIEGEPMEKVLKIVTSNVARNLKMSKRKGNIIEGADADLLVIDKDIELKKVIAKGKLLMDDGIIIVKGAFEEEML